MAACINADTGVGPSMASGNQTCSGNIALLPAPPININTAPHVKADAPRKVEVYAVCNSWLPSTVSLCMSVLKSSVPA